MLKGGGGLDTPQFAQAERLAGIQGDLAEQLFRETAPIRGSLFGTGGTPARTVRRPISLAARPSEAMISDTGQLTYRDPREPFAGGTGGNGGFVEETIPGTPGTPGILQRLLEETAPPAIRLPPAVQIPPEIVTPQERETIEAQYGTAGERLLTRGVRGGALGQSLMELETARARDITGLESTRAVSDRARRLQQSFLDREFAIQQQELDRQASLQTSEMRRQAAQLAMGGAAQGVGMGQAGISSATGTNLAMANLASQQRAQTLGLMGQMGQTAGLTYGLRGGTAGAGKKASSAAPAALPGAVGMAPELQFLLGLGTL